MYVSINKGGNPPTFEYINQAKKNEGVKQEFVRLGDIDGDGRLDYCIIKGSGQFYCWRNGGINDMPSWEIMVGGMTFDASGMGDIAGMRLVDVNGDARADLVILDTSGKSRIIINQRGTKEDGPRLKPHWIEASSGHPGGFSGMTFNNFRFGRIFGTGKADLIVVKETNTQDSLGWKHTYNFDVYKNTGNGGRKVKGVSRACHTLGNINLLTQSRTVSITAICTEEYTTITCGCTKLETSISSRTAAQSPTGFSTTRSSMSAAIARASTLEIGTVTASATSCLSTSIPVQSTGGKTPGQREKSFRHSHTGAKLLLVAVLRAGVSPVTISACDSPTWMVMRAWTTYASIRLGPQLPSSTKRRVSETPVRSNLVSEGTAPRFDSLMWTTMEKTIIWLWTKPQEM